uniref:Endonuclease/exonuclease/phosphatase domain-containing protein n=1 Tax=Gadus morhua TaxID=8049 RepID=A0A8C5C1P2_GADMO
MDQYWTGASGVVVLFKGKDFCIKRVKRVIGGRLLCIDVEWHQLKFRIINVYCPPDLNERLEVLKEIQPLLVCGSDVILGGDFNCLMDKKDRMTVATVRLDSSSEMLNNLIKDFKLNDTFRYKNPNTPGYTWSNEKTETKDILALIHT